VLHGLDCMGNIAAVPDWIWFPFVFAFGCCIGSFLNVVIYRLPREKSLVTPPSACPSCGKNIRFYDNVPLLSWIALTGKCRNCKSPISPRYFAIELLTGVIFLALFALYFRFDIREGIALNNGGWLIYLLHIAMIGAFIAASAIDLELWIIPLSICWFVTLAGFAVSAIGPHVIQPSQITLFKLLPQASARTAAMAIGAAVGLGMSWLLIVTGLLKRSYESDLPRNAAADTPDGQKADTEPPAASPDEPDFNHRAESFKEILFLLPIILLASAACYAVARFDTNQTWKGLIDDHPAVSGLLGSLFGYFVGCGIVWAIRIFGTFAFAKEAMGLGDVHLMGAAGAVIGPVLVVVAFFIAPFFGLAWAGVQMLSKKIRQIPYGPFLSMAILTVMIFHDWVMGHLALMFYR